MNSLINRHTIIENFVLIIIPYISILRRMRGGLYILHAKYDDEEDVSARTCKNYPRRGDE